MWWLNILLNEPKIKEALAKIDWSKITEETIPNMVEKYLIPILKETITKNPEILFTNAMKSNKEFREFVEYVIRSEINKNTNMLNFEERLKAIEEMIK